VRPIWMSEHVSLTDRRADARIKLEPATPKKQLIQCVRTSMPTCGLITLTTQCGGSGAMRRMIRYSVRLPGQLGHQSTNAPLLRRDRRPPALDSSSPLLRRRQQRRAEQGRYRVAERRPRGDQLSGLSAASWSRRTVRTSGSAQYPYIDAARMDMYMLGA